MAKQILFIAMVVSGFYANAQSANAKKAQNTKAGLQASFSTSTLNAYQDASKNNVEDFYQYLQLLIDPSISSILKKEITESIYLLFNDRNTLVSDFTSKDNQKIPLPLLIDKIASAKTLKFGLEKINLNPTINVDNWVVNYNLKVNNGEKIIIYKLDQKVYLTLQNKVFGSESKEVWVMLLGEIEIFKLSTNP